MLNAFKYKWFIWFVCFFIGVNILYSFTAFLFHQSVYIFDFIKILLLLPTLYVSIKKKYDFDSFIVKIVPFYYVLIYISVLFTWEKLPLLAAYIVLTPLTLYCFVEVKQMKLFSMLLVLSIFSIPFLHESLPFDLVDDDVPRIFIKICNYITIGSGIVFVYFNIYFIKAFEQLKIKLIKREFSSVEEDAFENRMNGYLNNKVKVTSVSVNRDEMDATTLLYHQIIEFIEEHESWKDPAFDIIKLTDSMESNIKYVSSALNIVGKKNYKTLINEYRMKAIKEAFDNKDHEVFTIKHIYTECGFKSQSSFNRVFRQFEDMTPLEYLSKLK